MSGPYIFAANGEHEFSVMVQKTYDEINSKLRLENDYLKESLANLNQELNEIMNIRKEIYIRRKKLE